ncbi:MFS transporter [candidate division KSB1 bacterium]|nr:MFS transporter [candidate division KSB1 bacterium]
MNQRRLFIASCLSLVVTAMIFAIRTNIEPQFKVAFDLNEAQVSWVSSMAFFGFASSILVASPILDALGMRTTLYLAFVLHVGGLVAFIFAPNYTVLHVSMLFAGFGNGLVEAVINPLTATVYPDEKTHRLNVLHAWWPGGLIIGGLLAFLLTKLDWTWRSKMTIALIPTVIYGLLIFGQKFPRTERAQAGIPASEMIRTALNPAFLLLMFCMMLTASIELAPGQKVETVLKSTAGMSGTMVLVYGSAIMFVLRFFAGPIAHRISPIGMMVASVAIAGIGLFMLAGAATTLMAYVSATIFYLGVCFMWPTMLGIISERFPQGGAFTMGLMGFAGQAALGVILFKMGGVFDQWGATASFQFIAKLAIIPFIVFAIWWIKDYLAGGYKAVKLSQS